MGNYALGSSGVDPSWSSSEKDFVTTSPGTSPLAATVGHGIVNESPGPPQSPLKSHSL